MKKIFFLVLFILFFCCFGCADITEEEWMQEKVVTEKEVITVSEEYFEALKKEVAKTLEEDEDLIEKTNEEVVFEHLLEKELQAGYIIILEKKKELGEYLPPYEEIRDDLEEYFFTEHKDGPKFVRTFERTKENYVVVIE